jgi:hypothetical protein
VLVWRPRAPLNHKSTRFPMYYLKTAASGDKSPMALGAVC